MITAASDQRAYDALCDALSDEPREDICPTCGIECECRGPSQAFVGADIMAKTREASKLTRLTPGLGRTDEPDTEVVDVCEHVEFSLCEYRGIQPGYGGPDLELRNCPRCGTTLSREILVARFWLCASTLEIRIEFNNGHMSVFEVVRGDGQYPRIVGLDDEELALVAWNALGLGDCEDVRFAGWDADAWAACHEAHEARSAA